MSNDFTEDELGQISAIMKSFESPSKLNICVSVRPCIKNGRLYEPISQDAKAYLKSLNAGLSPSNQRKYFTENHIDSFKENGWTVELTNPEMLKQFPVKKPKK